MVSGVRFQRKEVRRQIEKIDMNSSYPSIVICYLNTDT